MRSMNGIGKSDNVTSFFSSSTAFFPMNLRISASVGDLVYAAAGPAFDTLFYVGVVTDLSFNPTSAVPSNSMSMNTSSGTSVGSDNHYFMVAKSALAESHGVTGHYGVITLTNNSTEAVELFSIEAEVMDSLT